MMEFRVRLFWLQNRPKCAMLLPFAPLPKLEVTWNPRRS
jgi:hypothetical protein